MSRWDAFRAGPPPLSSLDDSLEDEGPFGSDSNFDESQRNSLEHMPSEGKANTLLRPGSLDSAGQYPSIIVERSSELVSRAKRFSPRMGVESGEGSSATLENDYHAQQLKQIQQKKSMTISLNQCCDRNCTTCPPEFHELRRMKEMPKQQVNNLNPARPSLEEELAGLNSDDDDDEETPYFKRLVKQTRTTLRRTWYNLTTLCTVVHRLFQPDKLMDSDGREHFIGINPSSNFMMKWNRVFVGTMFLSFAVDPLFFFVAGIDKELYCVRTDWTYLSILVVFRTIFDFCYLVHMLVQFRLAYRVPSGPQKRFYLWGAAKYADGPGEWVYDLRKIKTNYLKSWFLFDVIALLPVPQIMAYIVVPSVGDGPATFTSSGLRLIVLVQYIPRIRRCYPLLRGSDTAGLLFESAWASFFFNLVMYVMASHVVGSIWYLGGVQRWDTCVRVASGNATRYGCVNGCAINCGNKTMGHFNKTILDDCRKSSDDSPFEFDYGVYPLVVKLAMDKPVFNRYIYSLQWGFTQISTLGGNQTPSFFIPEVFFMLTITSGGLLLFAVLIGNIQSFLQSLTRRTFEYQLQRRDVENWMSRRNLPPQLAKRVRKLERLQWSANRGVHDNEMLSILTEDLQRDVRRHLCLDLISKSELFQAMDNAVKDTVCKRMVHRMYTAGTVIIHEGELVDRMFFVRSGALFGSSRRTGHLRGTNKGVEENTPNIKEGDFFGEELLIAYLEQPDESNRGSRMRRSITGSQSSAGRPQTDILPLSERTIKCTDNVEGFTLEAADLDFICRQFKTIFSQSTSVQRALNKCSHLRRSRAARAIQLCYRYHLRNKLNMSLDHVDLVTREGRLGNAIRHALQNRDHPHAVRGIYINQSVPASRPRGGFHS